MGVWDRNSTSPKCWMVSDLYTRASDMLCLAVTILFANQFSSASAGRLTLSEDDVRRGEPLGGDQSLVLRSGRHGDVSSITCRHLGVYNAVVSLPDCGAFLCWYIPEIYWIIGVVEESRNSRSLWSRICWIAHCGFVVVSLFWLKLKVVSVCSLAWFHPSVADRYVLRFAVRWLQHYQKHNEWRDEWEEGSTYSDPF